MKILKKHVNYIVLAVAGLLVCLDQAVKYLAIQHLSPIDTFPLLKDILHFTYIENRGAAFGIFEGQKVILIGLTGLIILAMVVMVILGRFRSVFLMSSVGLIIAGGIGNLIDRIFRGFVIDFIHVKAINFAVFNLADCFVVIGTVLLLIYFIFLESREFRKKGQCQNALPDVDVTDNE